MKLALVLETATDLLVMHEEIILLQSLIEHLLREKRDEGITLQAIVGIRQSTGTYDEAWREMIRFAFTQDKSAIYANLPLVRGTPGGGGGHNLATQAERHEMSHHHAHASSSTSDGNAIPSQPGNQATPQLYDQLPRSSHQLQYSHPGLEGNPTLLPPSQGANLQYYHQQPGVQPSQYQPGVQPSQYQPGVQPSGEGWGGKRAFNPTVYQNLSPQNPTIYQNVDPQYPQNAAYQGSVDHNPAYSGQDGRSHPHVGHVLVSRAGNLPHPATTNPGALDPQQHLQHGTQSGRESVEESRLEDMNVHRQTMDAPNVRSEVEQDNRHSLPVTQHSESEQMNESINPDNLPAPIMDFTSPMGTPSMSGLQSGLLSGLMDPRGGEDGLLTSADSGPQGLKCDHISESSEEPPIETVNHPTAIRKSSSSESSLDLYGSGPKAQCSSSRVPSLPEEPAQEEEWYHVSEDDVAAASHPTTRSTQPAFVTQSQEPHALHSESHTGQPQKPPLKPRKMRDKTQSVEEVEDQHRGGETRRGMRSCQSGPNLQELERNSGQGTPQNLEKPQPLLRRSRSPSPAKSTENSPSNSPNPQRRQQYPTQAPSQPLSQTRAMPPKAQSVDTEKQQKQSNREISHFSSGSDAAKVLGRDSRSNCLPIKPSTAPDTCAYEPETPVRGILPSEMAKKFPKPSKTDQVPLTSRDTLSSSSQTASEPLSEQQLPSDEIPPSELPTRWNVPEEPSIPPPLTDAGHTGRPKTSFSLQKSTPVVTTTTAKAEAVITSKPDESRLDRGGEGAHALRQSINQDRSAVDEEPFSRERANAHAGKKRPERVGKVHVPVEETSFIEDTTKDSTTDMKGLEDTITIAAELEEKFGISLSETWECSYCTNLVPTSNTRCDVCQRPRDRETYV